MRQRSESFVLLIFLTLFILFFQFLISFSLYAVKIGFRISDVQAYYAGGGVEYRIPKSFAGHMESILPHLLVITILIFIVSHFLMFIKIKNRTKNVLAIWLALSALLEIFSGLLVSFVSPRFALLKIISFLSFEISFFVVLSVVGLSSIRHLRNSVDPST